MCDVAWLAGVIEGDGTYMLGEWKRDDKHDPKIGVQVKLYNTDAQIIRKAMAILDAEGITYHLKERELKPMLKPGGEAYQSPNPMLTITVSKLASVERLVSLLEPWTFGEKRHRLLLVRDYTRRRAEKIARAGGNFRAVPIDEGDKRLVRDFKQLQRQRDASTTGCETPQGEGTV